MGGTPIWGVGAVGGVELEGHYGHAPMAPRRTPRRASRAARCAPLLVVVTLLAAACSSSVPTGAVGATQAAFDGTVTLDKVVSPAPVEFGSAAPAPSRKLVVAVLTVHSPTTSSAKFAGIYSSSTLVDSSGKGHTGKSTAKYKVSECVAYPPFGSLTANQAAIGCIVFVLPIARTPVELKISGKEKADWTIAASAVQPGAASAPVISTPPTVPTTTPLADGSGTTTTTVTGNTGSPGAEAIGGTTTTTLSTGTGTGTTPTTPSTPKVTPSVTPTGHRTHGARPPRIAHVNPRGAAVGARVQIWGKRFTGVTQVTFNAVPAFIVKAQATRIVVVVPVGASNGPVVVSTSSGSAASPRSFIVL